MVKSFRGYWLVKKLVKKSNRNLFWKKQVDLIFMIFKQKNKNNVNLLPWPHSSGARLVHISASCAETPPNSTAGAKTPPNPATGAETPSNPATGAETPPNPAAGLPQLQPGLGGELRPHQPRLSQAPSHGPAAPPFRGKLHPGQHRPAHPGQSRQ